MSYRIGEIAAQAGVTVEAVRYYERIGLLPKAPRTPGGVRRYSDDAVNRILFVKQAQANGFSLAEIRELIGLATPGATRRCRQVQALLVEKLAEIEQKQVRLEEFRRTLQAYSDECERSLRRTTDPDCPVIRKIGAS